MQLSKATFPKAIIVFNFFKFLISKSKYLLKTNGKLILEIGYDQKYKVTKFLKEKKFFINKIIKDYGNNTRCIVSTKIK